VKNLFSDGELKNPDPSLPLRMKDSRFYNGLKISITDIVFSVRPKKTGGGMVGKAEIMGLSIS
jgi:hypothetical protein